MGSHMGWKHTTKPVWGTYSAHLDFHTLGTMSPEPSLMDGQLSWWSIVPLAPYGTHYVIE